MTRKAKNDSIETSVASVNEVERQRTPKIMQTNVPSHSLEEAIKVPKAIWDNLAGRPCSPIQVCSALDLSPSSSKWRDLAGASIAYGLTSGGWNAKQISIEPLGKRIVAPTQEGDDSKAIREAAVKPGILKRFYEFYEQKKFPKDNIAENILVDWGVPKERANKVLNLIKDNGYFAGLITEVKGNPYISIIDDSFFQNEATEELIPVNEVLSGTSILPDSVVEKGQSLETTIESSCDHVCNPDNNKVFISHGKNKEMVENLKELLRFGSFEPVVSIERETTAIPVPDKVFSDMRGCYAGIIHIEEEESLIDSAGNQRKTINENVLIEIGAAIALYKNRIILLCQKGIVLPSNLQGLYRCDYDGNKLDYEATMKLLKTFNLFKHKE